MIELIYTGSPVEVLSNAAVPFNSYIGGCCGERYESNTNTLTLTRPGKYLVTASADVALPADGVAPSEMVLSITAGGAAIIGSSMSSTPNSVSLYNNVASQAVVKVYPGCCRTIGLSNTGVDAVIKNQNLVAVKIGG